MRCFTAYEKDDGVKLLIVKVSHTTTLFVLQFDIGGAQWSDLGGSPVALEKGNLLKRTNTQGCTNKNNRYV